MGYSMVKRTIKGTLASSVGWRIFGPVVREPGVIVLAYHRILGKERILPGLPIEIFEAQMEWLRANCDPIAADELIERAERPSRFRPAVLVTFDDGYRDFHDLAYPIMKRLGIPATVFVATSFLDEGGMIWTERVQLAALSTRRERVVLPWSDEPILLTNQAARVALGARARAHLKTLPDADRRGVFRTLLDELGENLPRDRQMMTWDEVRRTMDITTYGGHTHTHPILSRTDPCQTEFEIATCRNRIAEETGRMPKLFAYPNGRPEDFTKENQEVLRRHGFAIAFATVEGIVGPETDWMAVQRLPGGGNSLPAFAWITTGRCHG